MGSRVEITNTYTNEVKNGLSPFFADFGINTMKQASFQLVIKSGSLQQALNVNINEPHFKLWTTDGRRVDANYDPGPFSPDRNNGTYIDQDGGLSLMKTDTGFVCAH